MLKAIYSIKIDMTINHITKKPASLLQTGPHQPFHNCKLRFHAFKAAVHRECWIMKGER